MPRGIQNVSGVSCHISCALQLLAHCVPPLISMLQEVRPLLQGGELFVEMAQFLCDLLSHDDSCPVDPTNLYQLLQRHTQLDPHNVGDVSTALYQLWQVIGKQSEEHKAIIDYLVGGGQTQQFICGKILCGDHAILRTKLGKVKRMACPFPLPLENHISLATSVNEFLHASIETGTKLREYDWDSQPEGSYTDEPVKKVGTDSERWTTTKFMKILQVPRYFFLSLDRFSYTTEGERIWKHSNVMVSVELQIEDATYSLKGGVIHVAEESIDEEGHYITILTSSNECWTLIDDDNCRPIDSETALRWMRGVDDGGTSYCAVLLAYGSESTDSEWYELTSRLLERCRTKFVDWSVPESLVGRRLKMRWAKGTFYEGIVEYYDPATGKHRILYNDGDVREYTLSNKTIEWLS